MKPTPSSTPLSSSSSSSLLSSSSNNVNNNGSNKSSNFQQTSNNLLFSNLSPSVSTSTGTFATENNNCALCKKFLNKVYFRGPLCKHSFHKEVCMTRKKSDI